MFMKYYYNSTLVDQQKSILNLTIILLYMMRIYNNQPTIIQASSFEAVYLYTHCNYLSRRVIRLVRDVYITPAVSAFYSPLQSETEL